MYQVCSTPNPKFYWERNTGVPGNLNASQKNIRESRRIFGPGEAGRLYNDGIILQPRHLQMRRNQEHMNGDGPHEEWLDLLEDPDVKNEHIQRINELERENNTLRETQGRIEHENKMRMSEIESENLLLREKHGQLETHKGKMENEYTKMKSEIDMHRKKGPEKVVVEDKAAENYWREKSQQLEIQFRESQKPVVDKAGENYWREKAQGFEKQLKES